MQCINHYLDKAGLKLLSLCFLPFPCQVLGFIGLCYYGPLCSQILNTNLYNVSQNIAALSYTIFKTTKQNKQQETDSCLPRYRAKHMDMAEIRRGIGFQKLEVWFCGRA